jgi:hypothetical protein
LFLLLQPLKEKQKPKLKSPQTPLTESSVANSTKSKGKRKRKTKRLTRGV